MSDWQPLSPTCGKCEQVTGKTTCFPGPCVFFHERSVPGTKSFNIATLDRIRRGTLDPVHARNTSPLSSPPEESISVAPDTSDEPPLETAKAGATGGPA